MSSHSRGPNSVPLMQLGICAAQVGNSSLLPPTWLPLSFYTSLMEDYLRNKAYIDSGGYDEASPFLRPCLLACLLNSAQRPSSAGLRQTVRMGLYKFGCRTSNVALEQPRGRPAGCAWAETSPQPVRAVTLARVGCGPGAIVGRSADAAPADRDSCLPGQHNGEPSL
jgi:hypothetical protein